MVDRDTHSATRVLVLGSFVLLSGCRPAASVVAKTAGDGAVALTTNEPPAATKPALRLPATLPEVPPEGPPPTAAPPAGTPGSEGRVAELVAIDHQRAIVQFIVPGPDHAERWWLALMHRDGSLAWVQTLSGQLGSSKTSRAIEIVGDTVSVITSEGAGNDPELSLRAFGLADGALRFEHDLGAGYPVASVEDGSWRYDVRQHFSSSPGEPNTAHLTASSPTSVEWTAILPPPPPPGPDPTVVGDAVVVRSEQRKSEHPATWHVFERSTGTLRGTLSGRPQSCSDGTRWFVIVGEELMAVDPRTLKTRRVTGPLQLSGRPGTWALEDCVVADGNPVALVSRGLRAAMVAFDAETLAHKGHVELGIMSIGTNGFDPMPANAHRVVTAFAMDRDGRQGVVIADPFAGRTIEHWISTDDSVVFGYQNMIWSGGYVLPTRRTLAVVDGDSGNFEGRAMLPEDARVLPQQIAKEVMWLPPVEPLRLGTRAPRLIDLQQVASGDVRGAVLADARPAATAPTADGRAPCPDPSAPLVGDGTGTDGKLGPVARTRLPTWDLDVLYETARALACAPGAAPARLMAWYVMEDARPLRNDNALLMIEDTTTSPPRFTVVQVYRHATNRRWNEGTIRSFDHRPRRAELEAFFTQSEWSFDDDWGRVIAGNVVDKQWRRATHLDPWRSFPKGIEQTD